MTAPTLFWHDYETSGADKPRDRPWQFAGQRTTLDLVPIGEPVVLYCRPAPDTLPQPRATAITGLTPQVVEAKGVSEAEFARLINAEMSVPGTCSVGFNSIRFDDEITRHLLYRNFQDPYEREWRNGNSRWDLIDVARLCHALRPEGIVWPRRPDGAVSFRLEDLASANGIQQGSAHDALSDVHTTIELARLLKRTQPGVFQFAFEHRTKQAVQGLLDTQHHTPLVHVASYYPSDEGCLTLLAPIVVDTVNANAIWCWDLRRSPKELLVLTDEQISSRLFETAAEREEAGRTAFGLRTLVINKSPAVVPVSALKGSDLARLKLNLDETKAHWAQLREIEALGARIQHILGLAQKPSNPEVDADLGLYEGFPTAHDKRLIAQAGRSSPSELAQQNWPFDQSRYTELLFRYRARNWPETLSASEKVVWKEHCHTRLTKGTPAVSVNRAAFEAQLAELRAQPEQSHLAELKELEAWAQKRWAETAST